MNGNANQELVKENKHMQDIKNEEYVTCPRCEKEVYKDAITCPFWNFGIMAWSEVVDMEKDPFKEYLRESEPDKAHKGYAWSTAIGLQAVDGLKPSKYLIDTAIQNIEGKITMKEAQSLIDSYYED